MVNKEDFNMIIRQVLSLKEITDYTWAEQLTTIS